MRYEGWMLCNALEPKMKCFRMTQYDSGSFVERFHEHVGSRRISEEKAGYLLRSLVCRFCGESGMSAENIPRNFLNANGREPPASDALCLHVTFPEAGVKRVYCGAITKAWYDEVISNDLFRCSA